MIRINYSDKRLRPRLILLTGMQTWHKVAIAASAVAAAGVAGFFIYKKLKSPEAQTTAHEEDTDSEDEKAEPGKKTGDLLSLMDEVLVDSIEGLTKYSEIVGQIAAESEDDKEHLRGEMQNRSKERIRN